MKITLAQLLEKKEALDKVLKKDLPFKLAYRLSKLASKVIQEVDQIDKTRNEMIKKYGKEEKEKGGYIIPKSKLKAFGKEWEDLIKEEVNINVELIPFETIQFVELSANDIVSLEEFIIPEEDKKTKAKAKKK